MIIYKDKLTGDELLSDTYKIEEVDDCYFEVTAKMKTETTRVDASMIGGNASAEAAEEDAEDSSTTGIDVVLAHRLKKTEFNKKEFRVYIKDYSAKILEKLEAENPERVRPFKKGMATLIKQVLDSFKDWEFYYGESNDPEGMAVMLNWKDDKNGDEYPYMIYFKDGLDIEKV